MCDCHSILECCVVFSGVKLSIRSFNLSLPSSQKSCFNFDRKPYKWSGPSIRKCIDGPSSESSQSDYSILRINLSQAIISPY